MLNYLSLANSAPPRCVRLSRVFTLAVVALSLLPAWTTPVEIGGADAERPPLLAIDVEPGTELGPTPGPGAAALPGPAATIPPPAGIDVRDVNREAAVCRPTVLALAPKTSPPRSA